MGERTEIARALVPEQPGLPGLAPPADEATELLRGFSVWEEGRDYVASRLPTSVERQVLQRRLLVLDRALKAFEKNPTEEEAVKRALGAFFAGYPTLVNADAPGLVVAYMTDLRTMPRFAIERALDQIKRGQVRVSNGRGTQVPLDPDYPPSSARVYDVAVRALHDRAMEQVKIQKLLRAKSADVEREMTPEERAAVGARIRKMADEARGTLREGIAAATSVERTAADERRRALEERRRAQWEEGCRAAWAAVGREPLHVGGQMVSPELARRVNPALFSGPE